MNKFDIIGLLTAFLFAALIWSTTELREQSSSGRETKVPAGAARVPAAVVPAQSPNGCEAKVPAGMPLDALVSPGDTSAVACRSAPAAGAVREE